MQHGHTARRGKIPFQPIIPVQTFALGLNKEGRIGCNGALLNGPGHR
jgi:hypothetical protein